MNSKDVTLKCICSSLNKTFKNNNNMGPCVSAKPVFFYSINLKILFCPQIPKTMCFSNYVTDHYFPERQLD